MPDLLKGIQEIQFPQLLGRIGDLSAELDAKAIELARALRKIAELEKKLREAVEMAIYDPLTGAVTRQEMKREIAFHFASLKRGKQLVVEGRAQTAEIEEFSILFFDLNNLKSVNDTFGHPAGDMLIKVFGSALRTFFKREIDTVCRWGGDEFVVLLGGTTPRSKAEERAEQFLEELLEIELNFPLKNSFGGALHKVSISSSVGIASSSDGHTNEEEIIAAADHAMYKHKREQKKAEE